MLETAIKWFYDQMARRVTYSMVYRNGPNSYDCSSAVYIAFKTAGLFPGSMGNGNTDSLFRHLEENGFIKTNSPKRGDVFIWGRRGASGGASGHTGLFVNNADIIHCAAGYNGIHVDNHAWLRQINGNPEVTFYTYVGDNEGNDDQDLDIGSMIKFDKTYTVDELKLHGPIWQVRTNVLCREGFDWDDNGIPVGPLVEVDKDGYATDDQDLAVGSRYILPGKYQVLDLGAYKHYWLAMIEAGGYKFWVDVETATEIKRSAAGTPVPGKRPAAPAPVPETPTVPEAPKPDPVPEPTPEPQPEVPVQPDPTPVPEPEKPIEIPKEDNVAFTEEQQEKLLIAQQNAMNQLEEIALSEAGKAITEKIPAKTKAIVYFTGDSLILFGGLMPLVPEAFGIGMPFEQAIALAAFFVALGTGLLVMFGIYKKGKS